MSMFLPDGPRQTQPPSGVADITPANPETTTADIALMQRVLSAASRNVNLIPSDFMAYVVDFIQTSRLQIPIGQVFGFTQFVINAADAIAASESTTSSSPADLSSVGPEVLGLGAGKYAVLWGCDASVASTSTEAGMFVSTGPLFTSTIAHGAITQTTEVVSVFKFAVVTLTAQSTDLRALYQSTDGTTEATFANRFLAVIRSSN